MPSQSGTSRLRIKLSQRFRHKQTEGVRGRRIEVLPHTLQNSLGFQRTPESSPFVFTSPRTPLEDLFVASQEVQHKPGSSNAPSRGHQSLAFPIPPGSLSSHGKTRASQTPAWMTSKSSIDLGICSNPQIRPVPRKQSDNDRPWAPCDTIIDNEDELYCAPATSRNPLMQRTDPSPSDVARANASSLYPAVAPLKPRHRRHARKSDTTPKLLAEHLAQQEQDYFAPGHPSTYKTGSGDKYCASPAGLDHATSSGHRQNKEYDVKSDSSSFYSDRDTAKSMPNEATAELVDDGAFGDEHGQATSPDHSPLYRYASHAARSVVSVTAVDDMFLGGPGPEVDLTPVSRDGSHDGSHDEFDIDRLIQETAVLMSGPSRIARPMNVQPRSPVAASIITGTPVTPNPPAATSFNPHTPNVSTDCAQSSTMAQPSRFASVSTTQTLVVPETQTYSFLSNYEREEETDYPRSPRSRIGVRKHFGQALQKVGSRINKATTKSRQPNQANRATTQVSGNPTPVSTLPTASRRAEHPRHGPPITLIYRDADGFFRLDQPPPTRRTEEPQSPLVLRPLY